MISRSKIAVYPCVAGFLGLLMVTAGCGSPDPMAEKSAGALEVYKAVMDADRAYEQYGIQIATQSTAPETGAILIEKAGAKGYETFSAALRGLADRPIPEAMEALQAGFANRRGGAKQVAAIALAYLDDPAAIEWLKGVVETEGASSNAEILTFLGNHGDKDLVEGLLYRRLESDDETVRDETFLILGQIRQPWAVEALKKGLAVEIGARRKHAILAMGEAGDPGLAEYVQRFVNTQGLVLDAIESLGKLGNPDAIPRLQKLAAHEDEIVQAFSAAALLKLGDVETAGPVLDRLATAEKELVRVTLANQLHDVHHDLSRTVLVKMTADATPSVVRPALLGLEHNGDAALEAMVLEKLSGTDPDVIMAALDCLGNWGSPAAVDSIEPLLAHDNPYVQLCAANAIMEIGGRKSPAE
jgi:HEAT repeat protein